MDYLKSAYGVAERRACRLVTISRSVYQYRSHRDPQTALRQRMCEIAATRVRYGYRKIPADITRAFDVGEAERPADVIKVRHDLVKSVMVFRKIYRTRTTGRERDVRRVRGARPVGLAPFPCVSIPSCPPEDRHRWYGRLHCRVAPLRSAIAGGFLWFLTAAWEED